MPSNNDGRVIINIDSNASKVARDFQNLTNDTAKYERILRNVAGTSNSTLPIYDKIRSKLKEQQAAANSAITSYQKLANAQKSGIGFNQLNSVTGSAIERLRNLALQGRQNSTEFQNLASVVRNANSQIQNANNVVNQAITGSKGFNNSLGMLGGSLGSLGGLAARAAAGFAAMKLKDYGQYALQTSAAFEQLAISFRVMTGSAQTGQELTDAIIKLGAETPMTAQQLSKAAQLLLSFGESAENIIPDLKLLGDITGGEVNRFNQLSLAFAQVGANGRLMGQDLLQMVNAGFNPLQIISQKTGKSMGELRKEMEEGRISFQMVAQAMQDATAEGGRYFGLMEQQAGSLNGLLSINADTWEQVAKNIGDMFLPMAKAAVQGLINLGSAILDLQNKMRQSIKQNDVNALYGALEHQQNMLSKARTDTERKEWEARIAQTKKYIEIQKGYLKQASTTDLTTGNAKTGFRATVPTITGGTSSAQKQKDAYERLQEAAKNARREVELNAIAYGTSSPQVQQAFEKYRNLNTQLNDINKLFEENTKKAKENGGAYEELQQKISETRNQLLNLAVSGQTGSAQFTMLKNTLKQYETQAQQANTAVTNSIGLSWKNISNTISSQLSYALTTPLQEGENAFERFGNVALNIISQIGQSLISQVLNNAIEKIAARGTDGVMTGAAAAVTQTAQGYASMAASTNMAALGISKIASSQTAATAALTSSAATVASAAATYKTAAVSAGQLASSITQAAISQAAYSAALVPIAGAALAPVAALATGTSIAAANVVASAGMLASRITAFKDGGVVNSPTLFPMAGNRTGLMGERGAEAIMPLKRTPSGQLGVQAQISPATVNVYNQSDSKIETVQRPDGDTDIFIRRVNNALRNERTQAGFSSALQRNQSRGVQAS